jgi:hypothetical protein
VQGGVAAPVHAPPLRAKPPVRKGLYGMMFQSFEVAAIEVKLRFW